MKYMLKAVGLLGAFSFAVTAFGQEATSGQGAQSEACRAYATTAGGSMASETMTGGMMSGGAMTGGAMTGGTNTQADQLESAIQNAIGCLVELRADIESGQNAEEAASALLNIRGDLERIFSAAQVVAESSETLVQLEVLQQQVSEQREEALTTLDQVTENLSALSAGGQ